MANNLPDITELEDVGSELMMPTEDFVVSENIPDISELEDVSHAPIEPPTLLQDIKGVVNKSRQTLADVYTQYSNERVGKTTKGVPTMTPADLVAHTAIQGVVVPVIDSFAETVVHSAKGLWNAAKDAGIPLDESAKSLKNVISLSIPDFIEEPAKDAIYKAINMAGNKIGDSYESYKKLKKDDPSAASYIEGVVDVGLMFAPPKVKVNAAPVEIPYMKKALEDSIYKQRGRFLQDLASPVETKDVLKEASQEGRVTQSKLGITNIAPSKEAIDTAKVFEKIDGVESRNNIIKNNNLVIDYLDKSIDKTQKVLDSVSIPVPTITATADNYLKNGIQKAVDDRLITGDSMKYAIEAAREAKRFIQEENNTLGGILRARKRFDDWVRTQKPGALEADARKSAITVAAKSIRNSMNDMIANGAEFYEKTSKKKLPIDYRTELKDQSLLINARDNILADKVFEYPRDVVGRIYQNSARVLRLKDTAVRDYGALIGLTFWGASAATAPYVPFALTAAGAGIGGYNIARSQVTKEALLKGVKLTEKALGVAKNPEMILQLKTDRAALIELLKQQEQEQ